MSGKGSAPRPVDKKKFDEGWDRVFGKKWEDMSDVERLKKGQLFKRPHEH